MAYTWEKKQSVETVPEEVQKLDINHYEYMYKESKEAMFKELKNV